MDGDEEDTAEGMDVDSPAGETVNGVDSAGKQNKEMDRERMLEEKREKFRKVWLGKVVTAFGSELDQLRKVCVCSSLPSIPVEVPVGSILMYVHRHDMYRTIQR